MAREQGKPRGPGRAQGVDLDLLSDGAKDDLLRFHRNGHLLAVASMFRDIDNPKAADMKQSV
jgi:hypothetical protein